MAETAQSSASHALFVLAQAVGFALLVAAATIAFAVAAVAAVVTGLALLALAAVLHLTRFDRRGACAASGWVVEASSARHA